MATLQQIAERTGLSSKTVSRILNGETKNMRKDAIVRARKVREIAKKMNYRPHAAARSMRTQQTHQVGVLLRNAPDKPLFYTSEFEFILGINQFLEPINYLLSIVRIEDVPVDGREMSRVFREKILDGMIVIEGIPDNAVQRVKELIPYCVFLDTKEWDKTNCIRRDEVQCGRTIGENILNLGYKRLLRLMHEAPTNYCPHYSQAERFEGIRSALSGSDVEVEDLILPPWSGVPEPQILRKAMKPDTVIVVNHPTDAPRIAFHGIQLGLCVGRDFGLVSCDESHDIQIAMPSLSRVRYDRILFGRKAGAMLLEMLEGRVTSAASVRISSEWFAGDTACGPNCR